MIIAEDSNGSAAGGAAVSLRYPAGTMNAVRIGNPRSKILIALLFAIHIYLSEQMPVAGPKKLQVRDDTSYMQR
jgi:hypothetical protein